MDREQLLQRKALLERKAELLKMKAQIQPEQSQQVEQPIDTQPKQPGMFQNLMTNLSRPGASVRERVRTLGQTGNIEQANQAADIAFKNPQTSERFQDQVIRQTNELMPEKSGTVSRFIAGLLPSIGGLVEDFATDPVQIGGALATEGALNMAGKIPYRGLTLSERASELPISKFLATQKGQAGKATDLAVKARNEAVRLFPQAEGGLEQVRNTGEQVSKFISPAKDYEELANQLELAKGINAGERTKLYESGRLSDIRSQHDPILNLINEAETSPTANTSQGKLLIKNLKEIQSSDAEFLNKQPREILNDPNFYQSQKQHYQDLAQQAGAYRTDPSQSIKAEAYRAMAEGYQNKTYDVSEAVKPINLEEKGLIEGTKYARDIARAEAMGMKPDLRKEAIYSISPSAPQSAARFARKGLLDRLFGSPAKGITKNISKLIGKSEKAQGVADLIESLVSSKNKPQHLMLEGRQPLGLPQPKGLAIELPYTGSPSGKPIEMWSDYYMIKPTEEIGQSRNIKGISKLPNERKSTLRELVKRRQANFGGRK